MAYQILIENKAGQGFTDYAKYVVSGSIVIDDKLNQPTTISMVLSNIDNLFVEPSIEAYVRIYSTRFGRVLATGFISTLPQKDFKGLNGKTPSTGFQTFYYSINIQSDDYLLNAKSIEFIPAQIGLGSGQLLSQLSNRLAPGFFDCTSQALSGDVVPEFTYDPTKTWGQYAKSFADAYRWRVQMLDKKLYYVPYDDQPLGLVYDETLPQRTFKTAGLNTQLFNTQLVNDAIVIGAEEPGNNHDDYFVGDGFTGNFGLRHQLFEGSSTALISEEWTESEINQQLWTVVDPTDSFTMPGTLNVNGGPKVFGQSYLLSNSAIEIAGKLIIETGEILPFESTTALLGGLYNQTSSRMPTVNLLLFGNDFSASAWGVTGAQILSTGVSGSFGVLQFNNCIDFSGNGAIQQILGPLATYAGEFAISFSGYSFSGNPSLELIVEDFYTGAPIIDKVVQFHLNTQAYYSYSGEFPSGINKIIPSDNLIVKLKNTLGSEVKVGIVNMQLEYGLQSTPYVDTTDTANFATTDVFLPYQDCIAGFDLRDGPSGVIPSVSGAIGVAITPVLNGALIAGTAQQTINILTIEVRADPAGLNATVVITLDSPCPWVASQKVSFEEIQSYTNLNDNTYTITSTTGPAGAQFQFLIGYNAPAYGPATDTGTATVLGTSFPLYTKENHNYVLRMIFNCYNQSRYNSVYRTLAGTPYGGENLEAQGDITWVVDDLDLTFPWANPVQTRITILGVTLPSFARYAPVNNYKSGMTLSYTTAYFPPQGSLQCQSFFAWVNAAALAPLTGFPLPPKEVDVKSLPLLDYELGAKNAIYGPVAAITNGQGGDAAELAFYSNNLPAVGTRIRFQSWEAQAAVARVQNTVSVTGQAAIVGDSGDRLKVFTDFNPLPRTSEECELAAAQAIADRINPTYNGSYTLEHTFFNFLMYDYPRTGRILNINAPERKINYQDFVVTEVKFTITELWEEQFTVTLSFGPSKYLQTLLQRFLPPPSGILTATDVLNPPTPIQLAQIGTFYASDLDNLRLVAPWSASSVGFDGQVIYVDVNDLSINCVEVRRSDTGWGTTNSDLIGRYFSQQFTLPRLTFEQTWYMRAVDLTTGNLSRRSKVVRVYAPLIPQNPDLDASKPVNPDPYSVEGKITYWFDFNGDIRNVYAIEIRASDNTTVLESHAIASPYDLIYTYDNTVALQRYVTLYVYFINTLGEYSQAFIITSGIEQPPAPGVTLNLKLATHVLLGVDKAKWTMGPYIGQDRLDIVYTIVQYSKDPTFGEGFIASFIDSVTHGGSPPLIKGPWVEGVAAFEYIGSTVTESDNGTNTDNFINYNVPSASDLLIVSLRTGVSGGAGGYTISDNGGGNPSLANTWIQVATVTYVDSIGITWCLQIFYAFAKVSGNITINSTAPSQGANAPPYAITGIQSFHVSSVFNIEVGHMETNSPAFGSWQVLSISESGNHCTAICRVQGYPGPQTFPLPRAGDKILAAGIGVGGYNGTFTVFSAVLSGTQATIVFINPTTGLGPSSGGTLTSPYAFLQVGSKPTWGTGANVTIAGASPAGWNGSWQVIQGPYLDPDGVTWDMYLVSTSQFLLANTTTGTITGPGGDNRITYDNSATAQGLGGDPTCEVSFLTTGQHIIFATCIVITDNAHDTDNYDVYEGQGMTFIGNDFKNWHGLIANGITFPLWADEWANFTD